MRYAAIAMRVAVFNAAEKKYKFKDFKAGDAEFPALQCAVGRILAVSITFQCNPLYYARCRTTFELTVDQLIPKERPVVPAKGSKQPGEYFLDAPTSYAYWVDKYGASEIIWFPFTNDPWLKVWNEVEPGGPGVSYSKKLTESCPFTGADNASASSFSSDAGRRL